MTNSPSWSSSCFADEIFPSTIKENTQHSGATPFDWFANDHYRWFNFSRFWAPLFHWVVTTDAAWLRNLRGRSRSRSGGAPESAIREMGQTTEAHAVLEATAARVLDSSVIQEALKRLQ